MESKKFDLEDRLVKFACIRLDVCDLLPNTQTGQDLETAKQNKITSTFSFLISYSLFLI